MFSTGLDFDPDELPDRLKRLLAYWNKLKGDCLVPSFKDFDPVEIPRLLPYIILVEVLRNEQDLSFEDFRFRYIGTYVEERMWDRYSGRNLSQILGKGPGSDLWNAYCSVRCEMKPKKIQVNYVGPMENTRETEEIFLPLSFNRSCVDFVLVGLVFR